MKRFALLLVLVTVFSSAQAWAYKILYAEQYYRLYHKHLYQYPEDISEAIYYLELALKADFANPLNALAVIGTRVEWERYRQLFKVHVNLKLTENYLKLGSKYDKMYAYFFNKPWKETNLKSLEKAERIYNMAYYYWTEARGTAESIAPSYIHLDEIQFWEDELFRMKNGDLDYEEIIDAQLSRLKKVRALFEAMDDTTY
ncbi:MAG: hypothetical protein E4H36_03715 [Spirochaetales bacterium]|nr:MAG: hypothetical protein E4H36_03715 [Spirochaetales bacterium]